MTKKLRKIANGYICKFDFGHFFCQYILRKNGNKNKREKREKREKVYM